MAQGPFSILGIDIDTEWRSDWKWHRIADCADRQRRICSGCGLRERLPPLANVGGWSLAWSWGSTPLAYTGSSSIYSKASCHMRPHTFLPFRLEDFPKHTKFGHCDLHGRAVSLQVPFSAPRRAERCTQERRYPILETLIVEGPAHTVLVPKDRYAQMRNVWCIPSPQTLCLWLERMGFVHPTVHNITPTTTQEQRTTEWMPFHSLAEFLDPNDSTKTIEGYPAPIRVVITAQRP